MSSIELPAHRYLGGTEMEYPALVFDSQELSDGTVVSKQPRALLDSELKLVIERHIPKMLVNPLKPSQFAGAIDGMASNGSRIYKDVGEKIEYATPEATSYLDTVHSDIAGERIVLGALQRYAQTTPHRRIQVYGCVGGRDGAAWGRHESYLLDRRVLEELDTSAITKTLFCQAALAHLATRQLFTGAGMLKYDDDTETYEYVRSQKIPSLTHVVHSGTMSKSKPLFNTRDEPHAERDNYYRWHVTSGDYTFSPWANWLATGSTALVGYMALVQQLTGEGIVSNIRLEHDNELATAKLISKDQNHLFEIANGQLVRAVDMQERLCSWLEQFNEKNSYLLTNEDREIISEWRFAIDTERADPDKLLPYVEWRKRLQLLEAHMERHETIDFDRLHKVEQAWNNLEYGIGVRWRDTTRLRGYDTATIHTMQHTPPKGSRASFRADQIKSHKRNNRIVNSANWQRISVTDSVQGKTHSYTLSDPFEVPADMLDLGND